MLQLGRDWESRLNSDGVRYPRLDGPRRLGLLGKMIAARVVLQNGVDGVEIDRFREVVIEPGIERLLPIRFLSISGECEQANAVQLRQVTKASGEFVAIHDWQADVQKNYRRAEFRGNSYRRRTVKGNPRLMPFGTQSRRKHLCAIFAVVD